MKRSPLLRFLRGMILGATVALVVAALLNLTACGSADQNVNSIKPPAIEYLQKKGQLAYDHIERDVRNGRDKGKEAYDHVERDTQNGYEYSQDKSQEIYDHGERDVANGYDRSEEEISNCLQRDGCSLRGKEGKEGEQGEQGEKGDEGEQGEIGPEGPLGPEGSDGKDGENGSDGSDGEDGEDGLDGEKGDKGDRGSRGRSGRNGQDGEDGEDGADGEDGQDAVIEIIDPCGDSRYRDEIIMRMSSGELIAYFEDGGKRFLSVLTPGYYRTTDRQRCYFRVTSDLRVTWND